MREWEILRDMARLFDEIPDIQFWMKDKEGRGKPNYNAQIANAHIVAHAV